jgi:hypothetical protein
MLISSQFSQIACGASSVVVSNPEGIYSFPLGASNWTLVDKRTQLNTIVYGEGFFLGWKSFDSTLWIAREREDKWASHTGLSLGTSKSYHAAAIGKDQWIVVGSSVFVSGLFQKNFEKIAK